MDAVRVKISDLGLDGFDIRLKEIYISSTAGKITAGEIGLHWTMFGL